MKAELYIIDDNGNRVNTEPYLVLPKDVDATYSTKGGILYTDYVFEFCYCKLNDDCNDINNINKGGLNYYE